MSSPQELWEALPPVTRTWLGVSLATTTLVRFEMLSPEKLLLFMPFVYGKLELWRLVTCFVFFGGFSFNLLIQLYFLSRYSGAMEADPYKTSYAGGTADHLFSLIFMGVLLLLCGWAFNFLFLGPALVFATLYLWSKRHPEDPVMVWMFRFKGAQLPWVIIGFNILIGGSPVMDLMGVLVGHMYYFLVEVYPLSRQKQLLTTPDWLIRLVVNTTGRGWVPPPGQAAVPGRHNWGGGGRPLGAAN